MRQSQACPRDHLFGQGPPNLDQRCKISWLRSLLFWGLIELAVSNLTYFQSPVYLQRFCVFEIFVRPTKTECVPPKRLCTYMLASGSCHGPWNSRILSLVWPLLASQFSTWRLAMDFLMLRWAFAKLYIPHMPKCCMPIFGNGQNNSITTCICFYRVRFPKLGLSASFLSALFLAQ